MKTIKRYLSVWFRLGTYATESALLTRSSALTLLIGKFLRFGILISFFLVVLSGGNTLAGYTQTQILLFFMTFSLIDNLTQFLMREVYRFRGYVISGSLDFILLKPFSALFRSLFGGVDILDLPLSIVSGAAVVWLLPQVMSDPLLIIGYVLLICAGLCLATALHICVLSCGLLILEVENLILIYRDLTNMARIPISAYADPLRTILTYVIPIGIMMSFPVEFILGVLSVEYIPFVLLWCVACLIAAQRLWKYALSRYTSAA